MLHLRVLLLTVFDGLVASPHLQTEFRNAGLESLDPAYLSLAARQVVFRCPLVVQEFCLELVAFHGELLDGLLGIGRSGGKVIIHKF